MLNKIICFLFGLFVAESFSAQIEVTGINGETVTIETDNTLSVNEIKTKFAEKLNIPPLLIDLVKRLKVLDDKDKPDLQETSKYQAVLNKTRLELLEEFQTMDNIWCMPDESLGMKKFTNQTNRENRNIQILADILRSHTAVEFSKYTLGEFDDIDEFVKSNYTFKIMTSNLPKKNPQNAILQIIKICKDIVVEDRGSNTTTTVANFKAGVQEWVDENKLKYYVNSDGAQVLSLREFSVQYTDQNGQKVKKTYKLFVKITAQEDQEVSYIVSKTEEVEITTQAGEPVTGIISEGEKDLVSMAFPLSVETGLEFLDKISGPLVDQIEEIFRSDPE